MAAEVWLTNGTNVSLSSLKGRGGGVGRGVGERGRGGIERVREGGREMGGNRRGRARGRGERGVVMRVKRGNK